MEVIEQVSISLVICGSSEWHYTGYAFVDRNFGGPDDDLDESSFLYDQVNEDPIPSDCCGAEVIDANFPMWDCRAYYLSIVDHRSARVVKEWRVLVRLISRKIHSFVSMIYLSCLQQTHVRTHTDKHQEILQSTSLSGQSSHHKHQDTKELFDWNEKTLDLLGKPLHVLSETIKAWDVFSSSIGDSGYFNDTRSNEDAYCRIKSSLRNIDDTFESLKSIQQRLLVLKERRQRSAESVSPSKFLYPPLCYHSGDEARLICLVEPPFDARVQQGDPGI